MKIKITKQRLKTILIVGTFYTYILGGMIYKGIHNYYIKKELYNKALIKADTNHNNNLETDEVFDVYKKLKIDGKDIIYGISFKGIKNYFKQTVFKEEVSSELKEEIMDELLGSRIIKGTINLSDKNNDDFIDYEEAYNTFKIAYNNIKIEKLNLKSDDHIGIKDVLTSIIYPFTDFYKGSELERFVNKL